VSELIGYFAASLTTISFLPQVIQIVKTNDTKSISLGMYCIFVLGVSLWLVFGIMISSLPIILANAITLILTLTILILKIKNLKNENIK
jgi:MtN3 and saliva related transmembrane protein